MKLSCVALKSYPPSPGNRARKCGRSADRVFPRMIRLLGCDRCVTFYKPSLAFYDDYIPELGFFAILLGADSGTGFCGRGFNQLLGHGPTSVVFPVIEQFFSSYEAG
jgi:hypothetical protein